MVTKSKTVYEGKKRVVPIFLFLQFYPPNVVNIIRLMCVFPYCSIRTDTYKHTSFPPFVVYKSETTLHTLFYNQFLLTGTLGTLFFWVSTIDLTC